MKFSTLIVTVVLLLSIVTVALSFPKKSGTDSSAGETCSGFHCEKGLICKLKEVQCFRAPCPSMPECVPVLEGRSRKSSSRITCTNVRCAGTCVMKRPCPYCRKEPKCTPRTFEV